jgi:3-hydroxyisobutyrate dehydrogenase-like beta-hydroxyacid dehydrogenase
MKVGFCGSGLMGGPMMSWLLRAGHEVRAWNRTASKLQPLAEQGAVIAPTPAAAAQGTDAVCLCLLDNKAVEQVVFGPDGIATVRGPRWLVDHSSITPPATRLLAERLQAVNGAIWIDAPVSGGTAGAEAGKLIVLAGGPADAVESTSAFMRAYAARVTHMGPVGAGQTAKLCSQTIVATTITAIGEAVALARNAGLDPVRLTEAFGGGWADSVLLRIFLPRMTAHDNTVIGTPRMMLKDVTNLAALAAETGTPMPLASTVQQMLRLAVSLGVGDEDLSQIVKVFQRGHLSSNP